MSKTIAKPPVMTVTRQFFEGKRLLKEDEERTELEVLVFETEQISSTSVKLGLTVNLGNFESVRADVMVSVPHYEEERADAFLYALGAAEKQLPVIFGDKAESSALVDRARTAMKAGKAPKAAPALPPKEEPEPKKRSTGPGITERQLNAIMAIGRSLGWSSESLRQHSIDSFEVPPNQLTKADASEFIGDLQQIAIKAAE